MSLEAGKQENKKRRLRALDEQAQARVECILREQLDLEVYLKQREISTIAERLHHSEVLLSVLRSAIQSQLHVRPSLGDMADGLMSHMRRLAIAPSHGQGSAHQPHFQTNGVSSARKRGRPRRSAAVPARYVDDHSKMLYAQRADGTTVRMVCPYCRRDDFISLQGFVNHSRLEHDAHFASHEEAINICGVDADVDGDKEDGQANSDQSASFYRTVAPQAPRYDSLLDRLDISQRLSVTDALDFISKPNNGEQGSSDAESDSETESVLAYSKHRAKADGNGVDSMAPAQRAQDSRFHVVRRATFGNTSQYIDPAGRPAGHENSTHRWTVYIRSAAKERPVDEYIRKVRVFLHPSYRPDDIVDLLPPKFELTRWGWGEFPVRLQVFFCDKRNKPVELVYMIKLDDACSGDCVPGADAPIDFELDRRGLSLDESIAGHPDLERANTLLSPPPANAILHEMLKALCRTYPLVLSDALPANCPEPEAPEAILELVPAEVAAKWTWGVAITADVWRNAWPIGKRLSAEASRNRCLLSAIHAALDQQGNSISKSPPSTKSRLVDVVAVLSSACAVEANVSESLATLIFTSTDETCDEAIELLQLWHSEYRPDRPICANRNRGLQERSFVWSLRRWLRHNGFVPTPVLSDQERAACVSLSITCVADQHLLAATAGVASALEPVLARKEFFCSACGTLCVATHKVDDPVAANKAGSDQRSSVPSEPMFCCRECNAVGMSRPTTATRAIDVLSILPCGWDLGDDENDTESLLMVDDDNVSCSAATTARTSKFEDIARMISQHHLRQQERGSLAVSQPFAKHAPVLDISSQASEGVDGDDGEATDDLEVDWVWSTIRPLELSCAPASRFSASGTDAAGTGTGHKVAPAAAQVRLANSTDELFENALSQRLVVGRLLADVTKMFLRDLVAAADQTMRRNQAARGSGNVEAQTKRRLLMLTPLHVLAAVRQDPESFDACSNAYLADRL
ncbi:hypothetical protein GGI20_000125 [Coemansia sp. BCRC 34301]|nr:hypothetical protein GGI20_000125 [Coemansia sp. BCRC 34301]